MRNNPSPIWYGVTAKDDRERYIEINWKIHICLNFEKCFDMVKYTNIFEILRIHGIDCKYRQWSNRGIKQKTTVWIGDKLSKEIRWEKVLDKGGICHLIILICT